MSILHEYRIKINHRLGMRLNAWWALLGSSSSDAIELFVQTLELLPVLAPSSISEYPKNYPNL